MSGSASIEEDVVVVVALMKDMMCSVAGIMAVIPASEMLGICKFIGEKCCRIINCCRRIRHGMLFKILMQNEDHTKCDSNSFFN